MEEKSIFDLTPNDSLFNIGTDKGNKLLERSIKTLGCGKSIVVDKNDKVICGSKVLENAIKAGITKVRVIETTGGELVVVKRVDLKADSKKGYEMSCVDNICSQENLNWSTENLMKVMNQCWSFEPRNWGANISWQKKMNIDDFFTELEEDKKAMVKENTVCDYNYKSLFDLMEEVEEL